MRGESVTTVVVERPRSLSTSTSGQSDHASSKQLVRPERRPGHQRRYAPKTRTGYDIEAYRLLPFIHLTYANLTPFGCTGASPASELDPCNHQSHTTLPLAAFTIHLLQPMGLLGFRTLLLYHTARVFQHRIA